MKIIAELCQNHNGDFEILKEMVYSAKESGADYAKIQTIFPDMLTYRERFEKGVLIDGITKSIKRPYQTEYDRLKSLELSIEQQTEFIKICQQNDIKPLTTAFNIDSIKIIKSIGFKEIKIASYDCGSVPLLEKVKANFNRVFVSTGATYDDEIREAAKVLQYSDFWLLHCVTIYPTPLKQFHLTRMRFLNQFTSKVGWSDHSLVDRDGIKGTIAAIYYGAQVIERHFTTIDPKMSKDGPVSINPVQLKELKFASNLSKQELHNYLLEMYPNFADTLGSQDRILSELELLNRDYFRGRFANKDSSGKVTYNWQK